MKGNSTCGSCAIFKKNRFLIREVRFQLDLGVRDSRSRNCVTYSRGCYLRKRVMTVAAATIAAFVGVSTAAKASPAFFEDVSQLLGPLGSQNSYSATWADFDGDTWPDVFLSNHYGRVPFALKNQNGLFFSDVTGLSGLNVRVDYHTCKWADYDRDLDLDVFCSTGADYGTTPTPSYFYSNQGDGTFVERAQQLGVDFPEARGRAVTWLDLEGDGDLDLFYGTYVTEPTEAPSKLFRNDGHIFTDVTASAGLRLDGWVAQSFALDFDRDNDTDLLVSFVPRAGVTYPCNGCLLVLRNDGRGQFAVMDAGQLGLSFGWPKAMAIGDFDNDGDLDIFQGNRKPAAKMHRNNGNQTFSQVPLSSLGMAGVIDFPIQDAQWADFDNDGFLDLYVVRVAADGKSNAPNVLYLNNGNGTFRDGTSEFNAAGTTSGRGDGFAIADFDKNGFLDGLLSNGLNATKGPYQLFRNTGNQNHWLRISLTNTRGSPELGSKVWIRAGGKWQFREFVDNSGPVASQEPILHFGLGNESQAEIVKVQWPDGFITEWYNVVANQVIQIQRQIGSEDLVIVPDVVGKTESEARAAITSAGLALGAVTLQSSSTEASGIVLSQSPTATTRAAIGSGVALVVNAGPAAYSLSTASVEFGGQALNLTSSTAIITLKNTGSVVLPISSIQKIGANLHQFEQTNDCGQLLRISSVCTIRATFTPISTGSKTAQIEVMAGEGQAVKSVSLSGTGVRSRFFLSKTALEFGNVPVQRISKTQTVRIKNSGTVVLPISSITIVGADSAQFVQTNNCPDQVAVDGWCTVSIIFKPVQTGVMSAGLVVTPGGGAAPKSVQLSGTGT